MTTKTIGAIKRAFKIPCHSLWKPWRDWRSTWMMKFCPLWVGFGS